MLVSQPQSLRIVVNIPHACLSASKWLWSVIMKRRLLVGSVWLRVAEVVINRYQCSLQTNSGVLLWITAEIIESDGDYDDGDDDDDDL